MSDHPAASDVGGYHRYLEGCLCWVDGTPTHASSDQQRQCPKCRLKWSYERLGLELSLLREYCLGRSASEAARQVGCVKNTALRHYGEFRTSMEDLVKNLLLNGGIATNPQSVSELKSLEKALRSGNCRQREKSCRHLFLCSLNFEERIEALFQSMIVPAVRRRVKDAEEKFAAPGTGRLSGPFNAAPRRRGRRPERMPLHEFLRNGWLSFWREMRARVDPNCPHPSQACKKLGEKWVQAWEMARDIRRGGPREHRPGN